MGVIAPRERIEQWLVRRLDRLLRVNTAGTVDEEELGYDPALMRGYEASRWLALRTALPLSQVSERDVFVDLGSGKGRVIIQAARRYPFQRVMGVELSPQLNQIAAANVRACQSRLRCPVELVLADAARWTPPEDLTIVYMSNPFRGQVFADAIDRLVELVDRRDRPLRIIYGNPLEHAALMRTGRVGELPPPSNLRRRMTGIPVGWVRRYELRSTR